jgi:hypothetical protein
MEVVYYSRNRFGISLNQQVVHACCPQGEACGREQQGNLRLLCGYVMPSAVMAEKENERHFSFSQVSLTSILQNST